VVPGSGKDRGINDPDLGERLSKKAYETVGLGPEDVGALEVHDATAVGGKIPANPSGGLERKGHPVGARIGICGNGGGNIGVEEPAMNIIILERANKIAWERSEL